LVIEITEGGTDSSNDSSLDSLLDDVVGGCLDELVKPVDVSTSVD
jgi:hypothetical protein